MPLKITTFFILLFATGCNNCNRLFEYSYFENGTIEEKYEICNGERNGFYIAYYQNRNVRAEGMFRNNSFHKCWSYYYESGNLQSKQYYGNGKLININVWDEEGNQVVFDGDGMAISYYSENKPSSKIGWKNNLLHGENITWYESGSVASMVFYKGGVPCGIWFFYNEDGTLIRTEEQELNCD